MPCQPAFYLIFISPLLLHCSLFPIPTVPSVLSILVPFSFSNPYSFHLYQSLPTPTIFKKKPTLSILSFPISTTQFPSSVTISTFLSSLSPPVCSLSPNQYQWSTLLRYPISLRVISFVLPWSQPSFPILSLQVLFTALPRNLILKTTSVSYL